jgi:hypothetical protein
VKRRELIQKIEQEGAVLIRHGGKHDWYQNPVTKVASPYRDTARSKNISLDISCESFHQNLSRGCRTTLNGDFD